ncbi:MAG: hypothetical protein K0R63_1310 [Rickettsiales bacterium]|jgi:hypothetical protein|nr:hypothetical protein [Rickettsiales bacterium]
MKLQNIKKETIKKLLLLLGGVSISIIIYVITDTIGSSQEGKRRILENEALGQQGQLNKLIEEKKNFADSIKLWERLNDKSKRLEGLKIDEGKQWLEDAKSRYHLGEMVIELTPPEKLGSLYETETSFVEASTVSLRFSALSDEYALSFVDSILHDLPGYVKIEYLKISRSQDLNHDSLLRISKGEKPALVLGELTFKWQELKAIPSKAPVVDSAEKTTENQPEAGETSPISETPPIPEAPAVPEVSNQEGGAG